MKHILKYSKFVNENLTQSDIDTILDKVIAGGMESLSKAEKEALDKWNGVVEDDEKVPVEINRDGDLMVNGKRANPYKISSEFYDEKPEEITKWSPNMEDEVYQFLIDNFKRSSKHRFGLITDWKGNPIDKLKVIEITKEHFNCKLEELEKFIISWISGKLDLDKY